MSYSENEMINNFLTQVYKKLPEWLKLKKEEANRVLKDLEDQILNEARNIAEGQEPSDVDIQQALFQTGTPESIAKLYKKRGTPKLYITEELFDFYIRSMLFFFIIVIGINIIVSIFQFFFKPWWEVLGGMFTGMWIGCLITAIVITVLFVYFSMQGFLPDDFGVIPSRLALIFPFHISEKGLQETKEYTKIKLEEAQQRVKETITGARARIEQKLAEIKELRQEKLAVAELRREQKSLEAEMRREERLERAKQRREERKEAAKIKRELKKKQPVSIGELIFGAIAGIIFGLFIIMQPFAGIPGLFVPEFLDWLKIFGLLIVISGLINLIRLVIGVRNYTGQQIMLVIEALYSLAYIPIFLLLLNNPTIFPISFFSGGLISVIPYDASDLAYIIYFWVIIGIIIAIFGTMIANFYKVSKLQRLKADFY
ncbi:MAG: cell envelope integrity protein TolA [Candidatus Hodarchaeota archaeon]